ncbi:MAG TPA: hypothetical protein PKI41_13190 [Candidatus Competibacteraceae bacterium]|nr:hypothetical protein [Candidatus Competibacteraceae bacterium]HQA26773.1 hypothetical protein [Candidatus Competibacteraceae bacterium]HQD57511.1 hypothetical protein [Candidatus Competibacteraceae bacterium]
MWRSFSPFVRDARSLQRIGDKPGGLRREVIVIVLVKLALLAFIKVAFFSAPPPNGPEAQAQHLLGQRTSPVSLTQGKTL